MNQIQWSKGSIGLPLLLVVVTISTAGGVYALINKVNQLSTHVTALQNLMPHQTHLGLPDGSVTFDSLAPAVQAMVKPPPAATALAPSGPDS